jgi:hypothetical protein
MDEHLAAWQVAEFNLGGLEDDELETVYRHLDVTDHLEARFSDTGSRSV